MNISKEKEKKNPQCRYYFSEAFWSLLKPPPHPPPLISLFSVLLFPLMVLIIPHLSCRFISHFSLWAVTSTRERVMLDLYLYF